MCYEWDCNRNKDDKAFPVNLFMVFNHSDLKSNAGYYGYHLYQHRYMFNHHTDHSYNINLHASFFVYPKNDKKKPLNFGNKNSLHFLYVQQIMNKQNY